MPHQCVRCANIYDDGAQEILKGCKCGARLFFFIRKEKLEQARRVVETQLSTDQKVQIEEDVREMIGADSKDVPVVLDFECVRVLSPGKYEIDLVRLFKGGPLVFKLEEGKYMIDLPETFKRLRQD
ncbi:hypothetical protein HY486_01560 [Candidatus Woesearchaeota archaeon]|nr:hypothetical protein [Candidatus Woesearchaeota archaeon]